MNGRLRGILSRPPGGILPSSLGRIRSWSRSGALALSVGALAVLLTACVKKEPYTKET
jgi:hypothetical protein